MVEKNAKEMVKTAVAALQDKKGEDIRVIDISGVTVIADYFIIASGSNPNQVQALVDNVEEQMYKAGYDPQAFIAFFEKLQSKEKKKPGSLSKAFSSHPPIPDRIRNSQREIATVLPVRERYVVSTSEFSDVKGRVAALENRQRFNDGKESRPTLRRQQRSEGATARENDRPTLKRR